MKKEQIEERVEKILKGNNYVTCRYNGCFDMAAKKNMLLLIKVLHNVDSFQEGQAESLKVSSSFLDAEALLVGFQTSKERLKKGIVYERFDIPTVSAETFEELITHGILPKTYRDKGGLYVRIDSDLLRSLRKKNEMTQRELAEAVGINKKVIYEHEKSDLRMSLEIARGIESILKDRITKSATLFNQRYEAHGEPSDKLEVGVGKELRRLGFVTEFTKKTPFNVLAKEKALLLSGVEKNKRRINRRVDELKSFMQVADKPGILITEKIKAEFEDFPVIKKEELKEFLSGKELMKIAKKRR